MARRSDMSAEFTPNVQPIQFDIGALVRRAWDLFTVNAGILLGATVVYILIMIVPNLLTRGLSNFVLYGPMTLGFLTLILRIARGQAVDFGVLFSGFQRFLPSFVAGLLVMVFTVIGIVLCILPGIVVGFMYMLTWFYMADKNLDFWPAMETSRKAFFANVWPWVLVALVAAGINLVGLLLCGVGSLVSCPISLVLLALAYDQLEGAPVAIDEVPPASPLEQ
jgi:uncharacterized membrane protein